jgi:hypothetical protein
MPLLTNFTGGTSTNPDGGRLRLLIDGREIPFVSVTMTYALNTIPQAIVTLAIGKDVVSLKQSPAYKIAEGFQGDYAERGRPLLPVTLYFEGDLGELGVDENNARVQWPSLPAYDPDGDNKDLAVVFTGYLTSTGYRRSVTHVSLQLTVSGKLLDMTMSSIGSAQILPGSPIDFFTSIYVPSEGGVQLQKSYVYADDLRQAVPTNTEKALLDLLVRLATNPQVSGSESELFVRTLRKNTRVLEVITPTEDEKFWVGMGSNTRPAGYLANFSPVYKLQIAKSSLQKLSAYLSTQLTNSIAGGTFWNLLTSSILPTLGMGVVPLARSAILAPLLPLNKKAAVKIKTSEWIDSHRLILSQRPLYGVAVYNTSNTGSIVVDRLENKLGSSYVPWEKAEDGAWLFWELPRWLNDTPNALRPDANNASQVAMTDTIDVTSEESVSLDAQVAEKLADQRDTAETAARYAKLIYATNALRGREGILTTKLRFDISPGCTIEYETDDLEEDATSLFAFVTRVSVTVDAENAKSMTTLALANIRTQVENEIEGFSLSEHPFFLNDYFTYAPIVPELLPRSETSNE